ncbi:hypothetical protein GCM10009838_68990 [Catenulispora subtropica]|uniref:Protein-glutamine gamma-glutamyltransferase-like C-terminal domain-containing protein n=1 Tax=Catenulispora subtropica TaxID=450798 RepID=A0ABN2SYX0_9ACTN
MPAAVVVLAVAALSLAARRTGGLDNGVADGLWRNLRPAGALVSVLGLVVVAAAFAKHRDDGFGPLRRAGTATALLLVAAAVATPIGLLFFGRQPPQPPPQDPFQQDPTGSTMSSASQSQTRHVKHASPLRGLSLSEWVARSLLILVLAAAVGLIAYAVYRLVRQRWFPRAALPVLEFDDLVDADLEQLADAVAAGSQALAYRGDAREAVIACYAAMEDALGADGNGRHAADTPEDFLRRVTGAQLIPAGPARRLTDLFREARFSGHSIGEPERDGAREALDAISEHLRARAAAAQAAQAARAALADRDAAAATAGTGAASPGGPR